MTTILILLESQHPNAEIDHAVSFANWLETGDTINSVTVTASTGISVGDGSTAPAPSISGGNVVIFWLYGGTAGRTYTGQLAITTTDGRNDTVEWQISIIDPNS